MADDRRSASQQYDVLISSADDDRDFALGVLESGLRGAGVRVHHRERFLLGSLVLEELERAVAQSRFIVLVLSPAYLRDYYTKLEGVLGQHLTLEDGQRRVIPVIYRPTELPAPLRVLTHLDCTDQAQWNRAIERLCVTVGRPSPGPPEKPKCPYPGLSPFAEADHQLFFGRREETDQIISMLARLRRVLLIGPSGSGKSSLVFAGVIPHLASSTRLGDVSWATCTIRPVQVRGGRLASVFGDEYDDPTRAVAAMLRAEQRDRLLLIVDQLEEHFTTPDDDRERFVDVLRQLVGIDSCTVIVTMRADFYGDLMASGLWEVLGKHRVEILPLDRTALEDAIRLPALEVGVYVEAELARKLVDDAGGEPGMMPLVQETMRELWDRLEWRFLPLSAYVLPRDSYGEPPRTGLHRALQTHAEAAFDGLSPAQQKIAFQVFVRLVQPVVGRGSVRRQRTVAQLEEIVDDPTLLRTTIAALVNARLLTPGMLPSDSDEDEALPGEVTIDLAHEALITGWTRLGRWIDQVGQAEIVRLRLEAKAREWLELERRGGLLDAFELAEARRWQSTREAQELGSDRSIRDHIDASADALAKQIQAAEAARRHTLTVRNRWIVAVSVVAVLAVVAAIVAYRNAQESSRNAQQAKATELAAVAGRLGDQSLDLALLLSVEAYARRPVPEAVATLVANLARVPSLERILHGHDEEVRSVAISPDGTVLASAGRDERIVLWDQVGKEIRRLDGHSDEVHGLAFARDGSVLVSTSDDMTLRRWDPESGVQLGPPLTGHRAGIRGVSVDAGSRWIASASLDGTARLWDLASGVGLRVFDEHSGPVLDVAFNVNGSRLASAGQDGRVIVRDLGGAGVVTVHEFGVPVRAVAFHPTNGSMLAVALNDGTGQLWDLDHPSTRPEVLVQHDERVFDIAFNRDGTRVATASRDQSIAVVDLASRNVRHLNGHGGDVRSVTFSPDSDRLASGGRDANVMLWDLNRSQRLARTALTEAAPLVLQYSADGRRVASVESNGVVETFDVSTGQKIHSVALQVTGQVVTAALSPDNESVALGLSIGSVEVWNTSTGVRAWRSPAGHDGGVGVLKFAPDGRRLASGGSDTRISLWNSSTGQNEATIKLDFAISDVVFGSSARVLLATDANGTVWGWTLDPNPNEQRQLSDNQIRSVRLALSPDGNRLLVGTSQDRIRIWRVDGEFPSTVSADLDHAGGIDAITAAAPGRVAAADRESNRVTIWDLDSGRELGVLPAQSPTALALSPDGSGVAVTTTDGIQLWDLQIDRLLAAACAVANRNLTENEWSFYIGLGYEKTCPHLPATVR